jgi:protocatechuate 3,4-dioxygenase beta subunit
MALVASYSFAVEVIVEPREAHLVPGAQQAFTATAFNENGEAIPVEHWEWGVHPPRIGSITDDGLFTAGNAHGHGMVTAAFYMDSVRYVGRAHVSIENPRYFVVVRPRDAFLTPSETVQYEAWVVSSFGDSIGGLTYEWGAEPDWLGTITEGGLFTAGSQTSRGSVIARTIYEEIPLVGAGFVVISEAGWGGIAGTVTDEASVPIPHACVALFIPPHRDPIRMTQTDNDGNYLFEFLYPGSYWVRADARDYLPEFYDDSPGIEGATSVSVVGGSITQEIDFDLAHGGVISGQVVAVNSPDPLRHAHVTAFGNLPHPHHFRAPVDENGNYTLGGLPLGTYIVRADADGFAPEYWQEVAYPELATPIVIDAGSVIEGINFTLESILPPSEGRLSGLVTDDSTGNPIADAHIMVFSAGPRPRMFHQRTDSLGMFGFEHLPYGHYIVLCGARGYLHEYYDNVPFWQQAAVLTVSETSSPEIAIALSPRVNGGLCGFMGTIHDGSGNPLEGVLVRAEGTVIASAETGPGGNYYLDVPEGEYILTADRASLATRYYPNATSPAQATTLTVDPTTPEVEADFTLDATLDADQLPATVAPQKFGVSSIYPNPFNATARISYEVPSPRKVKLIVYDVLGQEVAVLVDGIQSAGTQNVTFNGTSFASGVYFVRLSGTWGATTHKMLLLK